MNMLKDIAMFLTELAIFAFGLAAAFASVCVWLLLINGIMS